MTPISCHPQVKETDLQYDIALSIINKEKENCLSALGTLKKEVIIFSETHKDQAASKSFQ